MYIDNMHVVVLNVDAIHIQICNEINYPLIIYNCLHNSEHFE
jgi:hypothetical protein